MLFPKLHIIGASLSTLSPKLNISRLRFLGPSPELQVSAKKIDSLMIKERETNLKVKWPSK